MSKINWDKYYQEEASIKRFVPEEDPNEDHRVTFALSLLPGKISSVLDVGCGEGYLCSRFKKKGINTIAGIDISKKRIKYAKKRFKEIEFKIGNLYDLLFNDNSYDLVSLVEVLEHAENIDKALNEVKRISKEYVLITVPSKQKIEEKLCSHCLKTFYPDGHLNSFSKDSLTNICKKNKLKVLKFKQYYTKSNWEQSILFSFMPKIILNMLSQLFYLLGSTKNKAKYIGVLCKKF